MPDVCVCTSKGANSVDYGNLRRARRFSLRRHSGQLEGQRNIFRNHLKPRPGLGNSEKLLGM